MSGQLGEPLDIPIPINPVPQVNAVFPRTGFDDILDNWLRADYPLVAKAIIYQNEAAWEAYAAVMEAYAAKHQGNDCDELETSTLLQLVAGYRMMAYSTQTGPTLDQLDRLTVAFRLAGKAHGAPDSGADEAIQQVIALSRKSGYIN